MTFGRVVRGLSLAILFAKSSFLQGKERSVRVNLVARPIPGHGVPKRSAPLTAGDLQVWFDGERQPIQKVLALGCEEGDQGTVAVILSSTEVGQGVRSLSAGAQAGAPPLESAARQAIAKRVLDGMPSDAAVEAYTWEPKLTPLRVFREAGGLDILPALEIRQALKSFDRKTILSTGAIRAENHLGGLARWTDLQMLANHLANRPGRKVVVWYCTNFEDSPEGPPVESPTFRPWLEAMAAMNREDVAVYPVNCANNPQQKIAFEKLMRGEPVQLGGRAGKASPGSERTIASYTGGRYYSGNGQLSRAIQEGLADSRCSYEVVWALRGAAKFPRLHSVEIRSTRPDVDLLYPEVYLESERLDSAEERVHVLEQAISYPVPMRAIPVRSEESQDAFRVAYRTDSLTFEAAAGGLRETDLDLIWAYYDEGGRRLPVGGKMPEIRLRPKAIQLNEFLGRD